MERDVSGGQIVLDADPQLNDEIASILTMGMDFIANYGWYFLVTLVLYGIFKNKINEYLDDWYQRREERLYDAKCKKNPELERDRLQAMAAARARLQEELDRQAAEFKEKLKQKEEQKRLETLKLLENGGTLLGSSSSKKFKEDYNPLMGDGGTNYRPPKKSCCKKGGGCG